MRWTQHVDAWHTSLDEQAAFAVQAHALAAAASYQRVGFYKMVDDHACQQVAEWGLVRDDGSRRPVAGAITSLVRMAAGFSRARFVALEREQALWSVWPSDPSSYTPNWQVYQVAFDNPTSSASGCSGTRMAGRFACGLLAMGRRPKPTVLTGLAMHSSLPRVGTPCSCPGPQHISRPAPPSGILRATTTSGAHRSSWSSRAWTRDAGSAAETRLRLQPRSAH